ncbi:MAG: transcription-repair coupling factor [Oceanospirillaceae bacterium]|uniref:transcription-repair coupling factor n=4 Tax=unclassified Thalassolituus TaxID=2624967 RepID=UPI000C382BF7|nr:transcription-repair coupling factor [Thalassolituus sp. UBA1505]MBS52967.1 transcription-repair coupling factor [Oceanospirillaceae bacterium]MBS54662.1 transcription-repair coupling factor [Oceanospirillaceae bacterium]
MASPFSPEIPTKAAERRFWGNLSGASQALSIASAAAGHKGLTLVICADPASALRLQEEIRFFAEDLPVLHFPDWEILPYDVFSPHQDIVSQRIATLSRLQDIQHGILILPVSTLLHRLPPASFYQGQTFALDIGQNFAVDNTRIQLESAGYHCVDTVYEHGEFAVRGSIVDIFPMGHDTPFRIELFDDEIETLRTFDPESQRTLEKVDNIRILPAREFPLNTSAIRTFKSRWFDFFDQDPKACPVFTDVSGGIAPAGIEYYLPLFFAEDLGSLFDHLPRNTLIVHDGRTEEAAEQFRKDAEQRYESRRYDRMRPILPPAQLFLATDQLFGRMNEHPRIQWQADAPPERAGAVSYAVSQLPDISIDSRLEQPLQRVQSWLQSNAQLRVLFCAESAGRREALRELLGRISVRPQEYDDWNSFVKADQTPGLIVGPLDDSVLLDDDGIAIVTENQLFGQRIRQTRRRDKQKTNPDMMIRDLSELQEGSPVVHLDHGVGRYMGLQTLEAGGEVNEFLVLEYQGNAKLYVPVSALHLISRYGGNEEGAAPISKLGTDKWAQAKRKAAEKIRDSAAELLDIYARREARKGFAFDKPDEDYERFAAGFPYEETPDQQAAIDAVIEDMCSPRPMDRLVCGDVGFGKTEVAMRAAFMAVQSGKQVAVLVPTTLLAQQHYQNFADRFAEWPVKVDVLSRFKSAKETQLALDRMLEGKTDIVVGTHKLLQKDVKFDHLGLLIIDEEHRFGVQQKERIKSLRAEVDILTLTATPIPRTLNMAMASIRDLSIIATPPAKRLSVKTFVRQHDEATTKEAILREILRGGQVYYLHNEVKSIEKTARELAEAIPEARVIVAHGQMSERELERVMSDFYHKRFNVLVCTTIIETGIDVPSANTIIIDRADKFGLAQLHQLRGRVGRSHHQAYAYLLTPPPKMMTKDAEKRLDAISASQDLGAGFMLATHDLEIRGAGELLGEEQSGQIETIGFTLYMDMLEQAVKAMKAGKTPSDSLTINAGTEVNLHIPALIPDDYLPDVNSRLTLYKRIASAEDDTQLKELQVEMIDRFGLLPDQVKNLFRQTSLKLKLTPIGIAKLDAGESSGRIEFAAETNINPFVLVRLVQSKPNTFRLEGGHTLRFNLNMSSIEQRFNQIDQVITELQKDPNL